MKQMHRASTWRFRVMSGIIASFLIGHIADAAILPERAQRQASNKHRHRPGQLLVSYKPTVIPDRSPSLDPLHRSAGVRTVRSLLPLPNGLTPVERFQVWDHTRRSGRGRFATRVARARQAPVMPDLSRTYLVELDPSADLSEALRQFAADPHVEFAQPNYFYRIAAFPVDPPNDTYADANQDGAWSTRAFGQPYEDLWGLRRIRADRAWTLTQGAGITVAVIDSGVDTAHEDLSGNAVAGFDFVNVGRQNLIDAGYDVDPGEDYDLRDATPADHHGHGTHVAGTIAARGHNAKGIIGVSPQAKIMPLRTGFNIFFPPDPADPVCPQGCWTNVSLTSDIVDAILHAIDQGADVINMSLGGPGNDPLLSNALTLAHANGLVLVASAGNEDADMTDIFPAAHPDVIAVAASDELDERAFFSNFGPLLDVTAPGGGSMSSVANILSLRSGQITAGGITQSSLQVGTRYLRLEGTSMAAPHVAGAAALLLSFRPSLTTAQVQQLLQTTADDLDAPGVDPQTGHGRINVDRAVRSLIIRGDLDGSSEVDAVDLQLMVNVLLLLEQRSSIVALADLDQDLQVAATDLQLLVNILLGL